MNQECIELYFKYHFNGYGWVFPLQNAVNIGVCLFRKSQNKALINDFLHNNFYFPKNKIKISKIEGYPIPITKLPKHFSKDKFFLIGDSAGLVDPVSGEGIHYAIRSGKIVADTIIKDFFNPLNDKMDGFYKSRIEKDIISVYLFHTNLENFLIYFLYIIWIFGSN